MRLSYLEKLRRGWGLLIDLLVVGVNVQVLFVLAFLPLYLFVWVAKAIGDTLPDWLLIVGSVLSIGYLCLVGPVVLFQLIQYCGLPWRFAKQPMQTRKADQSAAEPSATADGDRDSGSS
jgi:hypothetical protein